MFTGLYTALITPFNEDNTIDMESLSNLIKNQVVAGVKGIIMFGTTGEGMTLTNEERQSIIKHTVDLIREISAQSGLMKDGKSFKPHVIVGTGTNCTRTTIENSIEAEKLGADGVMIVTPYYNKPSQNGIYEHYKAINDAINIPIMIYNVPSRTCVNIDDDTLIRLIGLSNVYSLKDYDSLRPIRLYISWNNIHGNDNKIDLIKKHDVKDVISIANMKYELFKGACTTKFTILAGDDTNSLSIYVNGGHGCVSVASNVMPQTCQKMHDLIAMNRFEEARSIHAYLHPLYRALFCEVNPVPVKYMAYKGGLIKTPNVRLPLSQLSQENKDMIDNLLENY